MNASESRVMAAVVDALRRCANELSFGYRDDDLLLRQVQDALAQVAALQREGDSLKSAEGAQSDSSALLPCPFCGSAPWRESDNGYGWWTTECSNPECNCFMTESGVTSDAQATAMWNRRTPKDPT